MNFIEVGLIGVVIGLLIYALLQRPARYFVTIFRQRAPIIKKYWKFIVPFMIMTIIAYAIVARYYYDAVHFELLNQATTLILAIFLGYIAFSEYSETKFEKLAEEARGSVTRREFNIAKNKLEEAHSIKPKENSVSGDLAELYLVLGLETKFVTIINKYQENILEEVEKLVYQYLMTLKPLLSEHLQDTKIELVKLIEIVNSSPNIREQFSWNNDAVVSSDRFRLLSTSTQRMLTNMQAYLARQLNKEQEEKFISGSYDEIG